MTVLSLCDGMSCGRIALERVGVKVKRYYAAEIKEIAIRVTKDNYPDTVHIGDLTKIRYKDGILETEAGKFETEIDLIMFGSPCQTFSIAMKTDKRVGLENEEKSGLFLQCYRILKEVQPRFFFMENVASMKLKDQQYITELMGVEGCKLDAELVSAESRNRIYWTNLRPEKPIERRDVKLQDILEEGYTDRRKAHCLMVSDSRPGTTPVKMFHRYYFKGFINIVFKSEEHYEACKDYYNEHYRGKKAKDIPVGETSVFEGLRNFTQKELERCQCVPEGYTKCLTRNEAADVLGDGWNVDVIAYFLNELHKYGY